MSGPSDAMAATALDLRRQAALLAGVTLAVFIPTLSADFVYDARLQILTDPFLHDPRNWWPVLTFRTLGMDVLDFNRPVNLASLMLDAALWGKEPFGYHLTSVLAHVANVLLVWAICRRLLAESFDGHAGPRDQSGPRPPRGAAADSWLGVAVAVLPPLLFAVHPVVTEAVCEPTFREDLLVACFTLATLLVAMRHDPLAAGCDPWRAVACAACCLLAIGSKESGIAAPLLLAVYWWCFRRGEPRRFWAAAIGGGAVAAALFLAARFQLEVIPSRIFEYRPQYPGGSLAAAMAIEPRILALYAQLVVAPVNQCADYGFYSIRHLSLSVSLVVLVVLALASFLGIRRDRRLAVALALIVLPLLPVANLVPIYRAAADRYLYLPMAGIALVAGCLLDAPWFASHGLARRQTAFGFLAVLVVLAIGCTARQRVWSGPLSLWEDTFRKNPVAYTAASGLAESLREAGRLAEAEQAARFAIQLANGERGDAWATLALVLEDLGRPGDAVEALDKALAAEPRLARPADRVAALAMERPYAEALGRLLARRAGSP